ncbi:alanine racemase [Flavobacteriales bacterium]|nr:alanine racemase [Flavobacteriales bacterium]
MSIDLKKLESNFNYLKSKIKPVTKIIAVVKAFAYGHGDVEISKKLEKLGVYALWVTDFEEGVVLRKSGINSKIIVANPGVKSYAKIIKHKLDVVIYNSRLLDLYCSKNNMVNVHIKFNTGMNRYGFDETELDTIVSKLKTNTHLNVLSICSHLASADKIDNKEFTQNQLLKFQKIALVFERHVKQSILKHILNSHGVINFPKYQFDIVRLGIGLYGSTKDKQLLPISNLKSVITQNRTIKPGETIGYGPSFVATKEMNISIVPVGYADGLNRKLSNGVGRVIINGEICSIIGKISMGNFAVDTTDIIVSEGDIVEIFGENLSVLSIAKSINTIPYEIYSTLNRRLKRIYSD